MLVTRGNPYRDIDEFRRSYDRLGSMISGMEDRAGDSFASFLPAVNTREGAAAYHVEMDLPGVKKDDIEVNVHDNIMSLSGERHTSEELKEEDYYKVESEYGRFERRFSLPDNADVENIHAEAADGVLEVVIPKLDPARDSPKKIEIR